MLFRSPHTVTFRYTDILRAFVAQAGIWARGGSLGFLSPTVSSEERNSHNLLKDFEDEIPMYQSFHKVIETLKNSKIEGRDEDLLVLYEALAKNNIVEASELKSIKSWLQTAL